MPLAADAASHLKAGAGSADVFLAARFQASSGRSIAGILPVGVRVPVFGAALFAAAELTEEGRAPTIEFDYKKASRR